MPTLQDERIAKYLLGPSGRRTGWDDWLLGCWRREPALFVLLERRVAELMAVPQMRCRKRACRRNGRCGFLRVDDRSPWCLGNLSGTEREGYAQLLNRAMRRYFEFIPPENVPRTELDRASLELALAVAPAGDRRLRALRRFWRAEARAALPTKCRRGGPAEPSA